MARCRRIAGRRLLILLRLEFVGERRRGLRTASAGVMDALIEFCRSRCQQRLFADRKEAEPKIGETGQLRRQHAQQGQRSA